MSKRVNLTVDDATYEQLARLSHACNERPATLGAELVQFCLNNPNVVDYFQKKHNVPDKFRIRTKVVGDSLVYD
jgi:hypothetical protein